MREKYKMRPDFFPQLLSLTLFNPHPEPLEAKLKM